MVAAKPTQDHVVTVEETASKLLKLLSRTPVSAVGINFGYIENDVNADLAKIFSISDTKNLSGNGFEVRTTSVLRQIPFQDRDLNLRLSLTADGAVRFHFNFNKKVADADEALKAVSGHAVGFLESAEKILTAVYSLTMEDEDG